ncbi:MAG: hypothetical protein ACXQS2_00995 [Methermicoccaceae archaeon]
MRRLDLKIREERRKRIPPPTPPAPSPTYGGTKPSVPGDLESEV